MNAFMGRYRRDTSLKKPVDNGKDVLEKHGGPLAGTNREHDGSPDAEEASRNRSRRIPWFGSWPNPADSVQCRGANAGC